MGRKPTDISGIRYGLWTVISRSGRIRREATWNVRCECGFITILAGSDLRRGNTLSCRSCAQKTHGKTLTSEYINWKGMIQRCTNPGAPQFEDYGGRDITVCERWRKFENFLLDMGCRPTPRHSIDRKNTNGNYEPENCRWSTVKAQANNRRNNTMLSMRGITLTLSEWCDKIGVPYERAKLRIRRGWAAERALLEPANH